MKERNTAQFQIIVEKHYGTILTTVNRRLKNLAEAEDLTQEIFLKLFEKVCVEGTLSMEKVSERAYLLTVARNHVLDYFKKRKLATTELEKAVTKPAPVLGDDFSQSTQVLRDMVTKGLLNEKDLEVLRPKLQGFNIEEIAAQLGLSKEAAAKRYQRAKKKLEPLKTDSG